jgi:Protein of unknown function (DUF4089)
VDWEAYLDAVAPAVRLPVDPAWRGGVARFLGLAAEMAATLEAVELADDHLDLDAVLVLPEAAR